MAIGLKSRLGAFMAVGVMAAGGLLGAASSAAGAGAHTAVAGTPGMVVAKDTSLKPRATLCKNQAWTSGNGRAVLRMQEDGNFVLYKANQAAWQAPNSWSRGNCAVFQEDGNFVVYDSSGAAVWASGTWHKGATLAVQDDGNVVIYDTAHHAVWATNTGD